MSAQLRFTRFAWGVLAYNLFVVLWGAVVRATGSGAGCGAHWPMCNGQIVPLAPSAKTLVEFSHRLTSGLAFLAVVALVVWAWRAFPRRHPVRAAAGLAMLFMVSEALVGAALVLLRLVDRDDSVTRTLVLGTHLVNTFLLLAFVALTAWWASGHPRVRLAGAGPMAAVLGGALVGVLVIGVTGAMTALGDTLFRPDVAGGAVRDAFSPTAHFLIRLRVLHPVIAVGVGAMVAGVAAGVLARRRDATTRRLAAGTIALVALQLLGGLLNVALMAPVWMQLVHLLMADALWLTLVLLTASALRAPAAASVRTAAGGGELYGTLERA